MPPDSSTTGFGRFHGSLVKVFSSAESVDALLVPNADNAFNSNNWTDSDGNGDAWDELDETGAALSQAKIDNITDYDNLRLWIQGSVRGDSQFDTVEFRCTQGHLDITP